MIMLFVLLMKEEEIIGLVAVKWLGKFMKKGGHRPQPVNECDIYSDVYVGTLVLLVSTEKGKDIEHIISTCEFSQEDKSDFFLVDEIVPNQISSTKVSLKKSHCK
ncbi:uncharacterized protein LOC103996540 isoform X2 [Musa acuminata AAA Group]|uniref:uncharacterized protein LOC103996540 isoform X2 n=1 Tax=Musa acuminata AAA Group TaxID=214697 RepID=UPI0031DC7AC9